MQDGRKIELRSGTYTFSEDYNDILDNYYIIHRHPLLNKCFILDGIDRNTISVWAISTNMYTVQSRSCQLINDNEIQHK